MQRTNGASPTIRLVFPADVESAVNQEECGELAAQAHGRRVLELGAWKGRTTIVMAQAAASLASVDTHQGDFHAGYGRTLIDYIANLNRYGILNLETFSMHVCRFDQFAEVAGATIGSFDMVFLDGFHSYDQVMADIEIVKQLGENGIGCFHDYGVPEFGVTRAVDETFGEPEKVVDTLAVVRL